MQFLKNTILNFKKILLSVVSHFSSFNIKELIFLFFIQLLKNRRPILN